MRTLAAMIIFSLLPLLCRAEGISVFFSPNGGCQQAVVSEIRKASNSIDIAMYYLSSSQIAHALAEAGQNNVKIRIVLDQGQEIESASKSGFLIKHGLAVRYHLGFGLMHNKFALIDGKILITGSFNWTRTAEEKNEENLLIISDPQTIDQFARRFEYLWNTSRPDARNARGMDALPAWFCSTFHLFCSN